MLCFVPLPFLLPSCASVFPHFVLFFFSGVRLSVSKTEIRIKLKDRLIVFQFKLLIFCRHNVLCKTDGFGGFSFSG